MRSCAAQYAGENMTLCTLRKPLPCSPPINAACTRFRRALLSDPERWCSFALGPAPLALWSVAQREAWLAAKLGLLRQVAGLVESFAVEGVEQLLEWAKPCRSRWSVERFLSKLEPEILTSLSMEGVSGRQALLTAAARFGGLTALELSSSSSRLPKNTAAVVGGLVELRFLVCWSGERWQALVSTAPQWLLKHAAGLPMRRSTVHFGICMLASLIAAAVCLPAFPPCFSPCTAGAAAGRPGLASPACQTALFRRRCPA